MAQYLSETAKKVTTLCVRQMKAQGEKISMLTSYDYTTAGIVDAAGIDIILVGDSASNVMAGNSTTLPITLDEMALYGRSVVRAVSHAMVVCDMPFGSYQVSAEDAVRNAIRLMQQTGADAVKLEGGEAIIPAIRRIIAAGIPVMEAEAERLMADAKALEAAGCFALVLEKIPAALTQRVCSSLSIPVIGIGAGPADGQVLVIDDMLGKNKGFHPKFLRCYADLHGIMTDAIGRYVSDVRSGDFPNEGECY